MQIRDYNFKQTCSTCPEQYDVFDKDGNQVCYVRLRWGSLTAEYPDVGGTYIYDECIGNDCGCFRSERERRMHLSRIAQRIEYASHETKCPHCGEPYLLSLHDFYELNEVGKAVTECDECDKVFVLRDDGDGLFVY